MNACAATHCSVCGVALGGAPSSLRDRLRLGVTRCRRCGVSQANTGATPWQHRGRDDGSSLPEVPGPISLSDIARLWGVSPQAVEHVERRALLRLRVRLEALGYTAADVLAYLDGLAPGRPEPAMGDE